MTIAANWRNYPRSREDRQAERRRAAEKAGKTYTPGLVGFQPIAPEEKTARREARQRKRRLETRARIEARRIPTACRWCSVEFIPNGHVRHLYCSTSCQNVAKSTRRKARLRNQGNALPSLGEVYANASGVCQLCAGPVDMSLSWPDPMCASIDHIVPISRGGRDEPSNTQLAHLRCNLLKGNRTERAA